VSLLCHLFVHDSRENPDPSCPLVGGIQVPVNLELFPFIVSSSFGQAVLVEGVRDMPDQVMGSVGCAFFKLGEPVHGGHGEIVQLLAQLTDDPLWTIIDFVKETGRKEDWPNVLERELDQAAVMTAREHLAYCGLGLTNVVAHPDTVGNLDFGAVTAIPSEDAPIDLMAFFAPPDFVGTYFTAGRNAAYVIHNLWRGLYVVHAG